MTTHRLRILAVLLSLAVVAGCGGSGEEQQVEERVVPVSIATVEMVEVSPSLEFSGSITASREASVGAMMSAQVRRMHVEPGDRVSEGDLMVEMAGEQLTQAEAQFVSVQKDWERMTRLLDMGAVTQQAFDQTNAAYQATKASYDLVRESTMIRAPFSGVVTATYLEEGEVFVLMPGGGASSPAIVELVQMDEVKVEISVSERDLPEIRKGLKAKVEVTTYPDRVFEGTVRLVEPIISPMTRTAKAEIIIPNAGELLRPGMFAHLTLELAPRDVLLVTHDGVLQQEGTGRYFSMLLDDGHARRVDVVLGNAVGEHREVLSGLEDGQTVITTGRYRLPDGAKVAIRQEEGDR
ncbi:MAG: efflux RND transporter periplasmic adaptor subunit [Candidatus Eisenbacteria bacterium]